VAERAARARRQLHRDHEAEGHRQIDVAWLYLEKTFLESRWLRDMPGPTT
jgi:hypothetical protein